jgi:hypothetical protein
MSKILLIVNVFVIFTSAFSIIPGLNLTNFGGTFVAEPALTHLYAIDAHYMEGTKLFSYKDLFDFYVYTGLELSASTSIAGANLSVGIQAEFIYPMYNFPLKLFGRTFIPTLTYQIELLYTFGKSLSFNSDDIWVGLATMDNEKGNYIEFYIWPYPFIIGAEIINF